MLDFKYIDMYIFLRTEFFPQQRRFALIEAAILSVWRAFITWTVIP